MIDLTLTNYQHIPTQSISDDARERTIAYYAPSKTFNLAGLTGSYHIIYNKRLRDRLRRTETSTYYNSLNVLSQHALLGAYSQEGMIDPSATLDCRPVNRVRICLMHSSHRRIRRIFFYIYVCLRVALISFCYLLSNNDYCGS